jgi:transcriptional regulator with XRE-family HTH domain
MNIRFTLKELVEAHRLDSYGIQRRIAREGGMNRQSVMRLMNNRTRNVSLPLLEKLCNVLIAEGVPADRLPQGLFGSSALWAQVAFAKTVTVYVAERKNLPVQTMSSDDVEVLTRISSKLSYDRAPAVFFTSKVPLTVKQGKRSTAEEAADQAEAKDIFERIKNSGEKAVHIIIGSQRSNPLAECFLADVYKATAFQESKTSSVPFYIVVPKDDELLSRSCCGGRNIPSVGRSRSRNVEAEQDEAGGGICYLDSSKQWRMARSGAQPAIVVVRQKPSHGQVEIALLGFSGQGTRLVGTAFFDNPDRFWKDSYQFGADGTRIATTFCEFFPSKTDPSGWSLETSSLSPK